VRELLESKGGDEEDQNRLACEMVDMLMYGCNCMAATWYRYLTK
jgi:hypothetical protein